MYFEGLQSNIVGMKEIARELIVFNDQFETIINSENYRNIIIDYREKNLLKDAVVSLSNQLRILNNSLPALLEGITLYKSYLSEKKTMPKNQNLSNIMYKPSEHKQVSLIISDDDKKEFIKNLSMSRLSIDLLKKRYALERVVGDMRKPNLYAKISNYFFRDISKKLIDKGYFTNLNRNLRKISSGFVVSSYVSMIFFTALVMFFVSLIFVFFLLFFNVSILFPFISFAEENILTRFFKFFWIILFVPPLSGLLFFLFPFSEAKNVGNMINQELPFITIHMSAIASSGVNPVSIFEIIVKSGEYRYTTVEFKKLLNLVNFHGEDIVSALRKTSSTCPSAKLGELFNGLAFTIKSGGDLHSYLNEHADTMFFDYKLERERYTRISETFMDIYISVAIAAPMIFLMIFIIIGSTGLTGGFFDLGINALSFLLILIIFLINIVFLSILRIQQPPI